MNHIRYANSEDMDTLACIHAKSFQEAFQGIIDDEILKERFSYERLRTRLYTSAKEETPASLIFADGIAVGVQMFGRDGNEERGPEEIDIWTICILPEYWGQKIGQEFLEWALKELKDKGYKKVSLWVVDQNRRARSFYEKSGFNHYGEIRIINIGQELKELRYTKAL